MSYIGGVVRVSCSSIGLMCVAQSCCVIPVFRGACCTFNISVEGSLTQGVDIASINQSFKQ
jgi:lipid-binding SYLF domain-containing protein